MDVFKATTLITIVFRLVQSVKAALIDERVTIDELTQTILPHVIVIVKVVDPKIDTLKLEAGLKSLEELGRIFQETRSLPGNHL